MNEEHKTKTTNRNYFFLLIILIIVYTYVVIKTIGSDNSSYFSGNEKNIFLVCALILGFIFYSFVYQMGKVIFAKLTGFKVLSLNVVFLCFRFINNKIKFDLKFSENFAGSLEVIPDSNKKKYNPILFHLGGLIAFLLVAVLASLITMFIDRKIMYIVLNSTIISLIVLMFQLFPFYMDYINDGFALVLLCNKNNREVYFDNLKQNAALKYKNDEIQLIDYPYYDSLLQAESLKYKYYYFMQKKDFENASKTCDLILQNKKYVKSEDILLFESNRLYFILSDKGDNECYDYFYSLDKEIRRYASNPSNYEVLKSSFLLTCKVDKTYDIYNHLEKIEHRLEDAYKLSSLSIEKELVNKAKEEVIEKFPDWKD